MSPDAIEVLRLVLELLFFDYGRPQHRLLLSAVKRLPPRCLDTVGHILTSRIQGEIEGFRTQGGWEGGKADSIVLGQTLSSLLWLPAFNDWIRYESRGGSYHHHDWVHNCRFPTISFTLIVCFLTSGLAARMLFMSCASAWMRSSAPPTAGAMWPQRSCR